MTLRTLGEATVLFAGIIGVVSALVSIAPRIDFTPRLTGIIVIAAAALAAGYAVATTRFSHLPVDDIIPSDGDNRFSLEIANDRGLVSQAYALAGQTYGGAPAIPLERYEQWLMVNPNMLVCLLDHTRRVVGYFDVFPLCREFMTLLSQGVCTEQDILREHILPPSPAAMCAEQVYLGGISVENPGTHEGTVRSRLLLWGLVRYLEHFYGAPCRTEVLATAATPDGLRLLTRLSFEVVTPARPRKDHLPLYKGQLTDERIGRLKRWLPSDPSRICRIGWTEERPIA